MIKIVIADDEKWVRAIIKSIISAAAGSEFMISGEASDGEEALHMCLELSPDVLITDIRMPEMEGLELIASLKQPLPNLKTVIISGYDEFNYAQKAVKLGAFDYLLKPIEEENLLEVLEKVKKAVGEHRKKEQTEELLKAQHQAGFHLLREKFLNELININSYSIEELKKQSKRLGLVFDNPVFCVIVISIDDYVTKIKSLAKDQRYLILSNLKAYFDKFSKKFFNGYSFINQAEENEIIILCNTCSPFSDEYMTSRLHCSKKLVNRHFSISFSAGISTHNKAVNQLNSLFSEASKAVKYKMISGKGSILFYKNIVKTAEKEITLSSDTVNELVLNLGLLNENNVRMILNAIFMQLRSYRESTPQSIKIALWQFILDVVDKLDCKEFNKNKLFEFGKVSVYEEFKSLESLEDMKAFLENFFDLVIKEYLAKEVQSSQNVIETAKKYIEKNFNKEITLELISNYVFLNASYFSDLFKKETGHNFIEYLTNLRISKAKELLSGTSLKTYEVCEAVGYSDTKYFSKVFKKIVGVNPSEFRD